jgi:hypothetical protein
MSLPLEITGRKYSLERIENGDWDRDTDCINSRNQDLAEMQETHLAEVKNLGELKLWHPEPPACGSLLQIMMH